MCCFLFLKVFKYLVILAYELPILRNINKSDNACYLFPKPQGVWDRKYMSPITVSQITRKSQLALTYKTTSQIMASPFPPMEK